MSGSHSIDQATEEHSAVAEPGFAPPVGDASPPVGDASPPPPPPPPSAGPEPSSGPGSAGPKTTTLPTGGVAALERPEGQVGLAFAGGFLAALILKRLVG